jgi:hypothetical protein
MYAANLWGVSGRACAPNVGAVRGIAPRPKSETPYIQQTSFSAPQLRLICKVNEDSPPSHAHGSSASSGQHVVFCFSAFQSFEMPSYHRCLCFSVRPPTLLTRAENAMDLNSLPYNIVI